MIYLYIVALVIIAFLCIWYKPQKTQVILFGAFTAFSLLFVIYLMGKPKPYWSVLEEEQIVVFSAQYNIGKEIYIWTNDIPPINYSLPWNDKTAADLNQGLRKARKKGRIGVLMEKSSEDNKYVVHPLPPPQSPPKETGQ